MLRSGGSWSYLVGFCSILGSKLAKPSKNVRVLPRQQFLGQNCALNDQFRSFGQKFCFEILTKIGRTAFGLGRLQVPENKTRTLAYVSYENAEFSESKFDENLSRFSGFPIEQFARRLKVPVQSDPAHFLASGIQKWPIWSQIQRVAWAGPNLDIGGPGPLYMYKNGPKKVIFVSCRGIRMSTWLAEPSSCT